MTYGFEIINIGAVLGTACLMLAILIAWRSLMLFGKWLPTPPSKDTNTFQSLSLFTATFGCMFMGLLIVAYAMAVAPAAKLHPFLAASGILIIALSVLGISAVANKHTIRQYLVDGLYCILFILGGGALLLFWPS